MNEPLKIDRESGCWTLTLNRPEKRNALSTELVEALIAGVEGAHAQDVPLLVLCGAGTNLSRSEEHTSELQSLLRISYAVFCLKKKKNIQTMSNQHKDIKHNTPHAKINTL